MGLLEALKVILHPLQVVTTYLSAEYNVSVLALLPVLFGLVKSLQPVETDLPSICQVKPEISNEIERKWQLQRLTASSKNVLLNSTLLDPRFKQCKFLSTSKQLELKVILYLQKASIKKTMILSRLNLQLLNLTLSPCNCSRYSSWR